MDMAEQAATASMPTADSLPLFSAINIFLAAAILSFAGVRLTALADRLADHTRLGGAVFDAALLGGMNSLAGIVTSVAAAWQGHRNSR